PPRKKERQEGAMNLSPENARSGYFRFVFDKVSMLDLTGRFSNESVVGGVPWRTRVVKNGRGGKDRLVVFLYSWMSQQWSIEVSFGVILVNSDSRKN
ncbi:hypothetical protein PENTCL1PPCAC_12409, partial [Pristionchus entomophagus]